MDGDTVRQARMGSAAWLIGRGARCQRKRCGWRPLTTANAEAAAAAALEGAITHATTTTKPELGRRTICARAEAAQDDAALSCVVATRKRPDMTVDMTNFSASP